MESKLATSALIMSEIRIRPEIIEVNDDVSYVMLC